MIASSFLKLIVVFAFSVRLAVMLHLIPGYKLTRYQTHYG